MESMSRLSKYEQETIINYNRGDEYCAIATYDLMLIRRLKKFIRDYPECVYEVNELERFLSVEILKGRVSIQLTAQYSEERRKKLSENAKKNGFKSKQILKNESL